ncbi:uncharacterized protein LOC106058482 isoform X10 [Biomphalaria glabrata]|uniref:Uncharacterized protein LOC106058482 isoform X10 n=1 Tax=Biomphalaria glabrata TaxID=6526 RepID=A0A9W3BNM3_BIOGL|nr:uncharacterized protein LOC106058482 isoform X10 [Biomphalaria glabrata]
MSASQFDDLLGDFGDSTSSSSVKATANGNVDEFDPFGPSGAEQTTNGGDSGLLVDFSIDTEVRNGDSSNGLDFDFHGTSSETGSANPLYDMSTNGAQSSNPLYDLSSSNPLYDFSMEDSNQSANPLYDMGTDIAGSPQPSNPLYDLEGDSSGQDFDGTNEEQEQYSEDHGEQFEEQRHEENTFLQASVPDVVQEEVTVITQDDRHAATTTTFRSTSCIVLSAPTSPLSQSAPGSDPDEEEIIQDGRTISKTTRTENRYSDSGYTQSNQWEEQRNEQNVEQDRQTEQDVIHFTEMSSVKNKFESQAPPAEHKRADIREEVMSSEGGVYESQPQSFQQWQNEEEEEEGVYESTPAPRPDIAREADKDLTADLPPVGTAQSIRAKFLASTSQDNTPKKREVTPPAHGSGGEYVSEPRGYIEKYEGKADAGVFESQPVANPDVVTSTTALEDPKPEHGFAKNVAAKFKELENKKGTYTPTNKRELTPDRSGRIEYVSEPRGQFERYEGRAESGVFESQPAVNPDVIRSGEEVREELPERGTAKNIAQKFRQISSEPATSTSRGKRELTPDKSGRVEYVSEPRSQMEMYEVKVDSGVFENQPQRNPDVVTSETSNEEYLPERGYAKNVAAKFKSLESNAKSPPLSPGRHKEFTPPREEERARQAVVLENTPDFKTEIIHSGDQLEEKLPERGTAKNIAQRFKQLESESKSPSAPRQKKDFTPPPHDAGVYENQPKQFHADYNRPAESGILENTPIVRDDVIKATEPRRYEEELPERGSARNMVNKWKQLETAKSPGSTGRPKEFTPPREEPRIAQQRNPKSPRTPLSPSGYDQLDNGSVHPRDLPGQYQPLNEPTVFESTPEVREGVLKESDTDWTEGMPKKDQAKKMLAKFQHIQEEAKKQSPVPVSRKEEAEVETKRKTPRKDSTYSEGIETESDHTMENDNVKNDIGDKVGRSKSMRAAIQTEKCGACDKTVYAMERLEMNKRVYHKACFRCTQCKAVLTPKTFAINNEVIFCTNHYKQLFATKGNYDEGFGRVQHKKRWSSNPNLHEREGEEDGKHTVKS